MIFFVQNNVYLKLFVLLYINEVISIMFENISRNRYGDVEKSFKLNS